MQAIYRDIPTPYAWYGLKPEFFDAPSRGDRYDMDWEAHSFLCVSPDAVVTPHVQAITGFSWGFTVAGAGVTFVPPAVLGPEAWDGHLDLLRTSYPAWTFNAGYLAPDEPSGREPLKPSPLKPSPVKSSLLNRRTFLTGAAVLGASAVTAGRFSPC
jgi:hypothetical protein